MAAARSQVTTCGPKPSERAAWCAARDRLHHIWQFGLSPEEEARIQAELAAPRQRLQGELSLERPE